VLINGGDVARSVVAHHFGEVLRDGAHRTADVH
jgi:hypothetical protein